MTTALTAAEADLFRFGIKCGQPAILRSMREFAEQEIRLPDGPFEGDLFNCERQPFAGLWLDAVDSGKWNRVCTTGPTQSGKSLLGFVIPTMYHLFEVQEKVICGLPSMEMAADKWKEDFLPVILASRYASLLPTKGAGSRGGTFESIRFKHGKTLKFMSGGGNDKKRASFTARVIVMTETDGMDEAGENSREADKISQIEARTNSFGENKRIYMECTVSIEKGRTWQEYTKGTYSKIVLQCWHCREWVTPEREDFKGWRGAESEVAASAAGHFECPNCSTHWTDEQRGEANRNAKLVHRGQSIDSDGTITGDLPPTRTLGLRWSAVNNSFATSPVLAAGEWTAANADDEENAEKERRQFWWALPHAPSKLDLAELDVQTICSRVPANVTVKGCVAERFQGTDRHTTTLGIDIGKHWAHWTLTTWFPFATGIITDYGIFEVPSRQMGEEAAILAALRTFRDECVLPGWPGDNGTTIIPEQVFIDSGWQSGQIYEFCKESGFRFLPTKGFGTGKLKHYSRPSEAGKNGVAHVGDGFHIRSMKSEKGRVRLVEIDADHWKSWLHRRLTTPTGAPGALVLPASPAPEGSPAAQMEHLSFAKHLTAEKETIQFVAGKGDVIRWEAVHHRNHWLDSTALSCVAGHFCGVRVAAVSEKSRAKSRIPGESIPADDRPKQSAVRISTSITPGLRASSLKFPLTPLQAIDKDKDSRNGERHI